MIKIGIDGNLLCGKRTGMGTVVHNVLPYWKSNKNRMFILFLPEKLADNEMQVLKNNGIKVRIIGKHNYFSWEQIVLPKAIKKEHLDVLWCPYNTMPVTVKCKKVVTINDVIFMDSPLKSAPTVYKKLGIIYRRFFSTIAAKKSDTIITISNYAKNEINRVFKDVSPKIKVIYLGADYSGEKLDENSKNAFFSKSGIKQPYILGFGSIDSRKNSFTLIKAYYMLPESVKRKYQLVLFGFRDYKNSDQYTYIKDNNIENIILLEYVSDKEKNTLYSESKMFIFPSLSEGFGIPVLEAFANNTPVITSNTTSIPEVAGDAAILINPTDAKLICSAIEKITDDDSVGNKMIALGKEKLKEFDWKETADNICRVLMGV